MSSSSQVDSPSKEHYGASAPFFIFQYEKPPFLQGILSHQTVTATCSYCRRPVRISNIDNKKSESNAPLVLLKMYRFISRSTVVCWSLYPGRHRSPISPCTLCYKTRKGPLYQKLSDKVGSQRQTLCIENKAKPIYLTLDN